MLLEITPLDEIKPNELDFLLTNGWFRGSSFMYRTKIIAIGGGLHSVINIRLDLLKHQWKPRLKKLMKQNSSHFTYTFGTYVYSIEKEELYQAHKEKFKGFVYDNLEDFFSGEGLGHPYKTQECCVYDGDKLVAVSYFDCGTNSMASLLGLFSDKYKKYSLGKFTMMLEIEYAIKNNLEYYYPGYILSGENTFDYKLSLGTFEYYDWQMGWDVFSNVENSVWPDVVIRNAMEQLKNPLDKLSITYTSYTYSFFSLAYISLPSISLVSSPLFFHLFETHNEILIIGFNYESLLYEIQWVSKGNDEWLADNMQPSKEELINNFNQLLKVEQTLLNTSKLDVIEEKLIEYKLAKLL